jgi:hypothetical protein
MEHQQGQEVVVLYWLLGEKMTAVAEMRQKFQITF